ncbi:NAD-dependent epimerase/dehydratase family protein [Paenibacillus popilliae]|uniref:Nucleoside-diphosphate sugar epimerase n=1 Tax=Paenibacillus popilliae ATCC 14706 TaxID=1212764 RepID=M9LZ77_PAEPP|nr:NAD-dependent epimerase/dehydratase family protein [Paenibacillus popilliae]GAC41569.1 nucleoside-diphosphate sugar epimerase [Paenibacillus popilliae ATCC 14706]
MKILVTGATGFVGSNLVRALLNHQSSAGIYITARNNSDFWRIDDIKHRLHNIYYLNLDDKQKVNQLIESLKPNIIYHVATYGGFTYQADQEQIIKSNLLATMNLLDAAVANKVKHFINTGSSSEYGIKDKPMKESDVCEPVNFYGITKLAATNYCAMLGKQSEFTKVCTLRLFSPYGEYEDSSRLYPSIVKALRSDEPPRLSRPHSVRDFIPIDRVVNVYLQIINAQYNSGEIINVGSGVQQSIEQFYKRIAQQLNKTDILPIWGEAPPRPNEPNVWVADTGKLNRILNVIE